MLSLVLVQATAQLAFWKPQAWKTHGHISSKKHTTASLLQHQISTSFFFLPSTLQAGWWKIKEDGVFLRVTERGRDFLLGVKRRW